MTEVLTRPQPQSASSHRGLDRPIAPMISSAQIARRVRRLGRQGQCGGETDPQAGRLIGEARRAARPSCAAAGRGQDRLHRVRHPGPIRDRLWPGLRRAVSRAASHLFADIASPYLSWKKAELHSPLDGAVRVSTAEELSGNQGLRVVAPDDCPSQAEYIKYFEPAIAVMQTEEALERIALELCIDSAAENVDYLEVRWAPRLHLQRGLTVAQVIRAVLSGLDSGPIEAVAIVCAMRQHTPDQNVELARVAGNFAGP